MRIYLIQNQSHLTTPASNQYNAYYFVFCCYHLTGKLFSVKNFDCETKGPFT